MATPKKLLIITSNEDIIRQLTSHQMQDTYIMDLDNEKQFTPTEASNLNNPNITADFSSLSQLNASSDQPSESSTARLCKSLKVTKEREEYVCVICGDQAIGYNYDVFSCAPCKIFFRRNAHQDSKRMRCLSGTNQCSIECWRRRKCPRCRLARCFSMGMKKEFLLTEEEKRRRKTKNNEQVPSDVRTKPSGANLSTEDQGMIERIHTAFLSILEEGKEQCACVDVSDRASALISWSQYLQRVALSYIQFFRQIEHFEQLNFDDRLILIKYNILPVTSILKAYYYRPTNDCCSDDDNEHAVRQRRFFLLCSGTTEARTIFVKMIVSLVHVTRQDPTLISLLSVLLLFSRGLSMDEDEPLLHDPRAVDRAHSYYTKLLWSYLLSQFGPSETERYFARLLFNIFQIQSSSKKLREYFHSQYASSNVIDQMAPIMQSLLRV